MLSSYLLLPFYHNGRPSGTVPELLFEKKGLIPGAAAVAFYQLKHGFYRFLLFCPSEG